MQTQAETFFFVFRFLVIDITLDFFFGRFFSFGMAAIIKETKKNLLTVHLHAVGMSNMETTTTTSPLRLLLTYYTIQMSNHIFNGTLLVASWYFVVCIGVI